MQVDTILNFFDCHHKFICCYKTSKLTGMRKKKDIEDFILTNYECFKSPIDIRILDQHAGDVTLDDNYIDDYKPFIPNATVTTSAEPTNSAKTVLTLQIILLHYASNSTIEQEPVNIVAGIQQNEDTQQIDQVVSTSTSQTHCIIPFHNASKMAFIDGFNVNNEQRDQYISDAIKVDTGATVGSLSMIQASKTSKQKYGCRLPRFRIGDDELKNGNNHVLTLLVYIVLDVYQSGKHWLCYHPGRAFVEKDNPRQLLNCYKIPIETKKWTSDKGEELKLIIVAIKEAKNHSSAPLNILCEFADTDVNERNLLHYRKSRLALVLQKNGVTQWETLVLSNEIFFTKNTSDQCSKRTKKTKGQNYLSTTNLSTNMNDSYMHLNQNHPIYNNTSQVIDSTSQTILNASPSSLQLLVDSSQINSSLGNSNNMHNNHLNDLNVLDQMDANSIILNIDPSLYDAASSLFDDIAGYDTNCPFCGTPGYDIICSRCGSSQDDAH
ncbi:unnamed protein product [Rotaria sordida]|uniref:Uncharacterized protein n=2 Tax=Rotaria sordida TaxID=392033 RepID=A0A819LY96_9BILA|nr:unnamed protein product [Rotaria sordida]